jgi:hypothetical protein
MMESTYVHQEIRKTRQKEEIRSTLGFSSAVSSVCDDVLYVFWHCTTLINITVIKLNPTVYCA